MHRVRMLAQPFSRAGSSWKSRATRAQTRTPHALPARLLEGSHPSARNFNSTVAPEVCVHLWLLVLTLPLCHTPPHVYFCCSFTVHAHTRAKDPLLITTLSLTQAPKLSWSDLYYCSKICAWSGLCYKREQSEIPALVQAEGLTYVASGRTNCTSW